MPWLQKFVYALAAKISLPLACGENKLRVPARRSYLSIMSVIISAGF